MGRALMIGGLAATIFRQDLHPSFPVGALAAGICCLVYYVWKEDRL